MDFTKVNRINLQKKKNLFKYLPSGYLDSFINNGEILFRNLSFFQEYEDLKKRGDKLEGSILNNPIEGFVIGNISQNTDFKANFTSNYINANDAFVFCLSKKHDKKLYKEFESDCCVEITDVQEFTKKLGKALISMEFEYDDITYYNTNSSNNYNMIIPSKIPFYKGEFFYRQDEYRYIYSKEKLSTLIEVNLEPYNENETIKNPGIKKEQIITIGSLKNITRIHWLKNL